MALDRRILVYYEHPDWFRPLFAELERRGIAHDRVDASRHAFDPVRPLGPHFAAGNEGERPPLVVNRMSPSAWKRGRGDAILHTLHWLRGVENAELPVWNGVDAFTVETSKALQLEIVERLGLNAPRTRIVNHPDVLPLAALELEFPLVVKPNIGGSGAGIARFDSLEALESAVEQGAIVGSIDGILLLQEFHPPEGDAIVRVETLDGLYLYGIRVHVAAHAGFNLCPAEICRDLDGARLSSAACPAGAATSGLAVEGWVPPREIRDEAERIARAAGFDAGGVEYLVSARDGRRYWYDLNALSNFVAEPQRVIGFDPTARFVDALVARARAEWPGKRARREPSWVTRAHPARRGEPGSSPHPLTRWSAWSEEMAPAGLSASHSIVAPIAGPAEEG